LNAILVSWYNLSVPNCPDSVILFNLYDKERELKVLSVDYLSVNTFVP